MNTELSNVLYRLKRGLSGYISYLAACEMNQAFSEYVLYEPMLRILTAQGYTVTCEFPCPGLERLNNRGDSKKIDFDVDGHNSRFAIEVKWARRNRIDVDGDYEKLLSYKTCIENSRSFLCIFGRKSHIQDIILKRQNLILDKGIFTEFGKVVYADFGITKFGCRIYELKET